MNRLGNGALAAILIIAGCTGTDKNREVRIPSRIFPAPGSITIIGAQKYAPLPPKPFTNASIKAPPLESWLPPALSDEAKSRRIAADGFLAREREVRTNVWQTTSMLQDELNNKQYDLLQAQLDAVLSESIADPVNELLEEDVANFTTGNDSIAPSDPTVIDAWIKARPTSSWAHYSEGLRWSNAAWDARGHGFPKEISPEHWKAMLDDEAKAAPELREALRLNPNSALAWTVLLNVDRSSGNVSNIQADIAAAVRNRPASFLIAEQVQVVLSPYWMGDLDMMDKFAQLEVHGVERNPRLWTLQGSAAAIRGGTALNNSQWDVALREYNIALSYGDNVDWLDWAAEAAEYLHRYALAYRYYERSQYYDPNDVYTFDQMDIMDALCNPTKNQAVLLIMKTKIEKYEREKGDCDYYLGELPWGDEPLLVPLYVKQFSLQKLALPPLPGAH